MKRLISILFVLSFCITLIAKNQVSYSHKSLSAEGCRVTYSAIQHNDQKFILVEVRSDRLVFIDSPTMLLKNTDGEVITLKGQSISSNKRTAGVMVSNVMFPISEIKAYAEFPITDEEIEKLKDGVIKVRLTTIPITHEREFKKDKIGKKLYNFLKSLDSEQSF